MGLFSKIFNFLKRPRQQRPQSTSGPSTDWRAAASHRPSTTATKPKSVQDAEALVGRMEQERERQLRRLREDIREQRRQEDVRKIDEATERARQREQERLENDPEYRYLMLAEWVSGFQSSNVTAFRYLRDDGSMEVEFHDGSFYQYRPINDSEALSMYRAGSKGTWIWDNLRIRGTKLGHRKDYVWLGGPSKAQRQWDTSDERRREHDEQRARESRVGVMHPTTAKSYKSPRGNRGRRPK